MEHHGSCWHCGRELGPTDYQREAVCPQCSRHTHCCRNCRFYAPGRSNSCAEPQADHVADKQRANFCGYFEATSVTASSGGQDIDAIRSAAEDLFR